MGINRHGIGATLATSIITMAAAAGAPSHTTIVTHGYSLSTSKSPWIEAMADAIAARAGSAAVLRYRQQDGAWQLVSGTLSPRQPVVLIFRWLEDFEKAGVARGFAEAAGDALQAALRDPVFVDVNGTPLPAVPLVGSRIVHFIGHSRGTCVNSEAVRRLAVDGIPVDHVTTLDPHPVNGTLDFDPDWGDPTPRTWSNVAFADNYWRADGPGFINSFDFDGIFLPDALDVPLDEGALNCCAYGFAHSDVHLWYHGTIDVTPPDTSLPDPFDGEQTITDAMRPVWYPGGWTDTGFFYASLGGGAALRPPGVPGADPGPTPRLVNGGFEMGSIAGWLYHGGGGDGSVVDVAGEQSLQLSAPVGGTSAHRHNRAHVPADAAALVLDSLLLNGAEGTALACTLTGRDGFALALQALPLRSAGTWQTDRQIALPPELPRNRSYVLELRLEAGAGAAAAARIDNVTLLEGPACAGDATGDRSVGVDDLAAVIVAWGAAGGPADLNLDGLVGIDDLSLVVVNWGACGGRGAAPARGGAPRRRPGSARR